MDEGALDAYFTPIYMKKNRPATLLSVICSLNQIDKFNKLILKNTTSKGVRHTLMSRAIMERHFEIIRVLGEPVHIKIATFDNIRKATPEFEDCKQIANKRNVSLDYVMNLAQTEARRSIGKYNE